MRHLASLANHLFAVLENVYDLTIVPSFPTEEQKEIFSLSIEELSLHSKATNKCTIYRFLLFRYTEK